MQVCAPCRKAYILQTDNFGVCVGVVISKNAHKKNLCLILPAGDEEIQRDGLHRRWFSFVTKRCQLAVGRDKPRGLLIPCKLVIILLGKAKQFAHSSSAFNKNHNRLCMNTRSSKRLSFYILMKTRLLIGQFCEISRMIWMLVYINLTFISKY